MQMPLPTPISEKQSELIIPPNVPKARSESRTSDQNNRGSRPPTLPNSPANSRQRSRSRSSDKYATPSARTPAWSTPARAPDSGEAEKSSIESFIAEIDAIRKEHEEVLARTKQLAKEEMASMQNMVNGSRSACPGASSG